MTKTTGIIFIHGAGLASWIWQDVAKELQLPSFSIDFPERGHAINTKTLGFEQYCDYIMQQINAVEFENIILVAHSIGGVLATEIATKLGDRLVGIIGISAAFPKPNGSFISCLPFPQNIVMNIIVRLVGPKPPNATIRYGYCNDLTEEQTQKVLKNFTAESAGIYTTKTHSILPNVPKLYIKTTIDQEFNQALQSKMSTNLGNAKVSSVKAGHLAMLSKPKEVAIEIEGFTNNLARL